MTYRGKTRTFGLTVVRRASYVSLYHFRQGLLYLLPDPNSSSSFNEPCMGSYFPNVSSIELSEWHNDTLLQQLALPSLLTVVNPTNQLFWCLQIVIDLAGQQDVHICLHMNNTDLTKLTYPWQYIHTSKHQKIPPASTYKVTIYSFHTPSTIQWSLYSQHSPTTLQYTVSSQHMPVWTLKLVYNFLASIPVSHHWLRLPDVIHRPQTFSTFVFAPNVHKLSRYLYLLLNHLQQQSVVLASSETVSVGANFHTMSFYDFHFSQRI